MASGPLSNLSDVPNVDLTVVIATRDRPALLQRALASVACQTLGAIEVIVADDSSDAGNIDANQHLVASLGSRFRILAPPSPEGTGPSAARNRGVRAGTGRYVAFLDDDDQWTWDQYLQTAVAVLDRTDADLFCADMQGYRGDILEIASWCLEGHAALCVNEVHAAPPVYGPSRAAFVRAATRRVVHPDVLVVRRSLIEHAGGFSEEIRFGEDAEFVLRMTDATTGILFCPTVAARYRLPEGDSISLSFDDVGQTRQVLKATRKLRANAVTPEVRRAARDVEGWTLRSLARLAGRDKRTAEAFSLALKGLLAYPTPGAVLDLVRLPLRSAGSTGQRKIGNET